MRFSWKRWRLAPVAALTALALSLAVAGPAFAAEPGESGSWSGEWVGNQQLTANGSVSEARNGRNLLDVWRGATNNEVWLSWNNGDPFTLQNPDGSYTQTYNSPTVVPWGNSSFMVFHVGTDNNIYYTVVSDNGFGGWSWASGRWMSVPGQYTNMAVSVAQIGSGSYNLYMVYHSATDDRVWGTYFDGAGRSGWQSAEYLGGLSSSAPAVAFNPGSGDMFVVARGEDNTVWMTADSSGQWASSWWPLDSGPTYLSPSIAATWDGNMLVAYVDESNSNYHPTYRSFDQFGNPTGYWSTDITGWQTIYSVFLSVAAYSIYTLMNGLDGQVYWKQAYQG